MPIRSHITDPSTGHKASVSSESGEMAGLVVATRQLKTYENSIEFFTDTNGSIDMNIAASAGATPENVYDGGDKTQWTASTISGTFTLNQNNTHAKDATITVID